MANRFNDREIDRAREAIARKKQTACQPRPYRNRHPGPINRQNPEPTTKQLTLFETHPNPE